MLKFAEILDGSGKVQLFLLVGGAQCFEDLEVLMEDVPRDLLVLFEHLVKERLQASLPDIPLQCAETDTLPVEIPVTPQKHSGGILPVSKDEVSARQRSDTGLIEHRRWRRRFAVREQTVAQVAVADAAVLVNPSVSLKYFDSAFCATAETAVDGPTVKIPIPLDAFEFLLHRIRMSHVEFSS